MDEWSGRCHHEGPWTFSKFTSIEKMSQFKTTEDHEIDGVTVRFAESTVKGTTTHEDGNLEVWTKPQAACTRFGMNCCISVR